MSLPEGSMAWMREVERRLVRLEQGVPAGWCCVPAPAFAEWFLGQHSRMVLPAHVEEPIRRLNTLSFRGARFVFCPFCGKAQ